MDEEAGTTYLLGVAPVALIVTSVISFGFGGYLLWGWHTAEPDAVFLREDLVAGPTALRWVMAAMVTTFGFAGGYLLLRSLRNLRTPGVVRLTANAVIHSGYELSGRQNRIAYAEITRLSDMVLRGMPIIEIVARDGSKIMLGKINFRVQQDYDFFREAQHRRVPHLVVK